jgi:hypothetical protein
LPCWPPYGQLPFTIDFNPIVRSAYFMHVPSVTTDINGRACAAGVRAEQTGGSRQVAAATVSARRFLGKSGLKAEDDAMAATFSLASCTASRLRLLFLLG